MSIVDWSQKPEPWCWVGPQFRRECQRIAGGETPPPPIQFKSRSRKRQRKHRDAVPPDPAHEAAVRARRAEIEVSKERLRIEHELRAAGVRPNLPGRKFVAPAAL